MKSYRNTSITHNKNKKNRLAIYTKLEDSIVFKVYDYFDIYTSKTILSSYYDCNSEEVFEYKFLVVLDRQEMKIDESEYKRINSIILNKYNGNIVE